MWAIDQSGRALIEYGEQGQVEALIEDQIGFHPAVLFTAAAPSAFASQVVHSDLRGLDQ